MLRILLTSIIFIPMVLIGQWDSVHSGSNYQIEDIQMVNDTLGFHCGNDGLYKTMDGGNTWFKFGFFDSNSEFDFDYHSRMWFFDENVGIIVGRDLGTNQSQIIRTQDGGHTWTQVFTKSGLGYLFDVAFNSYGQGVAVGMRENIVISEDYGQTWTRVESGFDDFYSVAAHPTNPNQFVVVGDGQIFTGFQTFTKVRSTSRIIYKVHYISDTEVLAFADEGRLFRSMDGGANWGLEITGLNQNFSDAFFINNDTALVGSNNGPVLMTHDRGHSWFKFNQSLDGIIDLWVDNNKAYAVRSFGEQLFYSENWMSSGIPMVAGSMSTNQICVGDSIQFTNLSPAGYSYQWLLNGQVYATTYHASLIGDESMINGEQQMTLVLSSVHGTDSIDFNFIVNQSLFDGLEVFFPYDGDTLCANVTYPVIVRNVKQNVTYRLKKGGTLYDYETATADGDSIIFNLTVPTGGNANGNSFLKHRYHIEASGNVGCGTELAKTYFEVFQFKNQLDLSVIPALNPACRLDSFEVFIPNSDPFAEYVVQGESNWLQGTGDTLILRIAPNNPSSQDVSIDVRYAKNDCRVETLYEKPRVNFTVPTMAVFFSSNVYFEGDTIRPENNSLHPNFLWDFADADSYSGTSDRSPWVVFNSGGVKLIRCWGLMGACSDSIDIPIEIVEDKEFTPSNSSICQLDTFQPESPGYQDFNQGKALDLHVDEQGNYYYSGYYVHHYDFPYYKMGGFVRKFNPDGEMIYEKIQIPDDYPSSDDMESSYYTSMDNDAYLNLYVAGSFTHPGKFTIDDITVGEEFDETPNFFIAKLDSLGEAQWMVNSHGGNSFARGVSDILYIDDKHIYAVLNDVVNNARFTNVEVDFTGANSVIVQMDAQGNYIKHFEVETNGRILFEYDAFQSSSVLQSRIAPIGPKLHYDKTNNLIKFVGRFNGYSISFDGNTLNTDNSYHMFAVDLDTASGFVDPTIVYSMPSAYRQTVAKTLDLHQPKIDWFADGSYIVADYVRGEPLSQTQYTFQLAAFELKTGANFGFIAKYNADHQLQWKHWIYHAVPSSVIVSDSIGLILMQSSDMFALQTGSGILGNSTEGASAAFLLGLNADGQILWLDQYNQTIQGVDPIGYRNKCGKVAYLSSVDSSTHRNDSLLLENYRGYTFMSVAAKTCVEPCWVSPPPVTIRETEFPSLKLYPNPSRNHIQVQGPANSHSWELLDCMGRVVLKNNNGTKYLLDISVLPSGTYLLKALDAKRRLIAKQPFIKTQ